MFEARNHEQTAVTVYFDSELHAEAAINALEMKGWLCKLPLSKKACLVVKPSDPTKRHLYGAHVPFEYLNAHDSNVKTYLEGCVGAVNY